MELNVTQAGVGEPPLVLVHGFTGSVLDWAGVMPTLAEHRRVVAYDHRGHGQSPNTGDGASYTIQQLAADLTRLVDDLGLDTFHLLGHSMGGVVAQQYALANPARIRSLILMDTLATPALSLPMDWIEKMTTLGRTEGMGALADRMVAGAQRMSPPPSQVVLDNLRTKHEQMDPEAFLALARDLTSFEPTLGRLGGLRCPTTVLVGELDTSLRGEATAMHEAIGGSHLVVIDGGGHSPQEDHPVEWIAAIEAHLAWALAARSES